MRGGQPRSGIPILAARAGRRMRAVQTERERKHLRPYFRLLDFRASRFSGSGGDDEFQVRVTGAGAGASGDEPGRMAAASGGKASRGTSSTASRACGPRPPSSGPALRSSSALVAGRHASSSVLYSRNPDTPLPIASITKLMTSLVVLDAGQPLDEPVEITKEDRSLGKGAFSRLAVGSKLTRGELMHLALMSSENRAAMRWGVRTRWRPGVRARHEREGQVARHDARPKFVDPAGLSSENIASPRDLAQARGRRRRPIRSIRELLDGSRARGEGRAADARVPQHEHPRRRIPTGTSSCRRPATSPRPASAW